MTEKSKDNSQLEIAKTDLIALDTTSGITRWVAHKISTYNNTREAFILLVTLITAFIGGPALVFYGMSWLLAGSLGTSGGGVMALAFNNVICVILMTIAALLIYITIRIVCKPSHLLVSGSGLQYQFRTLLGYKSPIMLWQNVSYLIIYKPKNTTNPANYQVSFMSGTKRIFNIPLAWLNKTENKEKLLLALDKYLTDVPRDHEVLFYMRPPSAQSYTDIWFQSLRSAPELEKLILNNDDTSN